MLKTNLIIEQLASGLKPIVKKIINQQRISEKEGVILYKEASISLLGTLANAIRETKNGNYTYFNKNIHIEPTNICVFDCKFCSYSKLLSKKSEAWQYTIDEMVEILQKYEGKEITEVHLVGGVHPKMGLHYFIELIKKIKAVRPDIHVKAFTAVELEYMCRKAKVSYTQGLTMLKEASDFLGCECYACMGLNFIGMACEDSNWSCSPSNVPSFGFAHELSKDERTLFTGSENFSNSKEYTEKVNKYYEEKGVCREQPNVPFNWITMFG